MFSRPVNADVLANVKQEVELFRKELVVVVQVEAEKRIGFDKRAAADGDFSASLRDQVNCGEVLEDTYRIVGTENGDSAGETDALGASGCSSEENGRCGRDVLLAMVFSDPEDIETGLVGEDDLFEQIVHALGRTDRDTAHGVWRIFNKAVDAYFHRCPSSRKACSRNYKSEARRLSASVCTRCTNTPANARRTP